jgi:hypothetical protein
MKLVEIKDIREGQIWKYNSDMEYDPDFDCAYFIARKINYYRDLSNLHKTLVDIKYYDDEVVYCEEIAENLRLSKWRNFDKREILDCYKLIGFLDITHRIEDNKLIEIPREKFEIDDVIYFILNEDCSQEYRREVFGVINWICDDYDEERHECGVEASVLGGEGQEYIGMDFKLYSDITPESLEKIGVLGITHEFVNDKLVNDKFANEELLINK